MTSRHRLTVHFRVEEFDSHDGAVVPGGKLRELADFCGVFLEPLRYRFGRCTVVSGYRSPAHNVEVGGARQSVHLYGEGLGIEGVAADVRFAKGTVQQWATAADHLLDAIWQGRGGLGTYERSAGGWIHLDSRQERARWSG